MRTLVFAVLTVILAIPCWSKGVRVQEYALPAVQAIPYSSAVCGDWAVSELNSNPNNMYSTIGIIGYDLRAKQVFTIHRGKSNFPAITGNIAMWTGKIDDVESLRGTSKRGSQGNSLILYDLVSGRYWAPVLSTGSASLASAFGDLIVYESGCRVYMYNIKTGAQQRISPDVARNKYPDISGDLVVWLEYESGFKKSKVRGYRLSTGQEYYFSQTFEANSRPHTDGEWVAWYTTDIGGIFYEVKTGKIKIIKWAQSPDVSNGLAVYVKSTCACTATKKASKREVFGTDLRGSGEFRVSKGEIDRFPRIEYNRVFWIKGNTAYFADLTRANEVKLHTK